MLYAVLVNTVFVFLWWDSYGITLSRQFAYLITLVSVIFSVVPIVMARDDLAKELFTKKVLI